MTLRFLFLLFSFSAYGFLPSQDSLNIERFKKASLKIEIYKRPINEKTKRREFGLRDTLVSRAVAVNLGEGYLLTAYHVMKSIVEGERHHYVKITDNNGNVVSDLGLSRCEMPKKGKEVDLCLLKGNVGDLPKIELPKDLAFMPKNTTSYVLINQNDSLDKMGATIEGNFVRVVDPSSGSGVYSANNGVQLYRTNLKTAKANSGSVVFNPVTGRVLGITTNAIKRTRTTASKKETWLEAEVIPSHTVRRFLNTPGWKTQKLKTSQTTYAK